MLLEVKGRKPLRAFFHTHSLAKKGVT